MDFTLEGACTARRLIEESFEYAQQKLLESIREKNMEQSRHWYELYVHLMKQANWIDGIIEKI